MIRSFKLRVFLLPTANHIYDIFKWKIPSLSISITNNCVKKRVTDVLLPVLRTLDSFWETQYIYVKFTFIYLSHEIVKVGA